MAAHDTVVLAGALQNFGNTWINTGLDWVTNGLVVVLGGILIIHVVRKMSIKSAIGGVIGLVICWSIFAGRFSIAEMFQSEYKDPGEDVGPDPGHHRPKHPSQRQQVTPIRRARYGTGVGIVGPAKARRPVER
ncbi:hypothetical protein [Kitasatospora aureofaciens]|uniref:hypothetical protein n=1 Tax=Kitasatospora aureofaciens TaxID=1894 RepID=UPI000526DCD5|nr:hypothetical protein [Kitasatospora aureofaciens]